MNHSLQSTSCRFSTLLPYESSRELDYLSEEFTDYQLLDEETIPDEVRKAATIIDDSEKDTKYYRMDVIWHFLSSLKYSDSCFRFSRLANVAKLILVLPHSNAQEERVFSMVRKNKTSFRPSLDQKGTLSSILTIKLANIKNVHSFEPEKETLKKAKSATYDYNKQHSKDT